MLASISRSFLHEQRPTTNFLLNNLISYDKTYLEPTFYNHRLDPLVNCNWGYQLQPKLKDVDISQDFQLELNPYYEDLDFFTIEHFNLVPSRTTKNSVTDILIFGEEPITVHFLDYLFSNIYFRRVKTNLIMIDNYQLDFFFDRNDKRYQVRSSNNIHEGLSLTFNPLQKISIAYWLTDLMNETPPYLLNKHNYAKVVEWIKKNEIMAQRFLN